MANSTNWRSISYGKRGCSNVMVVEPQDAGKKMCWPWEIWIYLHKSHPKKRYWLVVSTHLKNISQNGNLPQVGMKKKSLKPPPRIWWVGSTLPFNTLKQTMPASLFSKVPAQPPTRKGWTLEFVQIIIVHNLLWNQQSTQPSILHASKPFSTEQNGWQAPCYLLVNQPWRIRSQRELHLRHLFLKRNAPNRFLKFALTLSKSFLWTSISCDPTTKYNVTSFEKQKMEKTMSHHLSKLLQNWSQQQSFEKHHPPRYFSSSPDRVIICWELKSVQFNWAWTDGPRFVEERPQVIAAISETTSNQPRICQNMGTFLGRKWWALLKPYWDVHGT